MGRRHHIHHWFVSNLLNSVAYFLLSLKTLPFAGFTGCVGALRENTTLLAAYAIFLAILLLLEVQPHIIPPPNKMQKLSLLDDLWNLGLHFQGLDKISGN